MFRTVLVARCRHCLLLGGIEFASAWMTPQHPNDDELRGQSAERSQLRATMRPFLYDWVGSTLASSGRDREARDVMELLSEPDGSGSNERFLALREALLMSALTELGQVMRRMRLRPRIGGGGGPQPVTRTTVALAVIGLSALVHK
jgi:hypothetical protein